MLQSVWHLMLLYPLIFMFWYFFSYLILVFWLRWQSWLLQQIIMQYVYYRYFMKPDLNTDDEWIVSTDLLYLACYEASKNCLYGDMIDERFLVHCKTKGLEKWFIQSIMLKFHSISQQVFGLLVLSLMANMDHFTPGNRNG